MSDFVYNDPSKRVHHVIRFLDELEHALPIQCFESFSPFSPVSIGDHINTVGWMGFEGSGLIATRISHKISEITNELLHETNIYCRWFSNETHTDKP